MRKSLLAFRDFARVKLLKCCVTGGNKISSYNHTLWILIPQRNVNTNCTRYKQKPRIKVSLYKIFSELIGRVEGG